MMGSSRVESLLRSAGAATAIGHTMAAPDSMRDNIRKFEEIGTHPASQRNAITEALNFHDSIGGERKAARFRYLRKRWSNRLSELPGVKILLQVFLPNHLARR